MASANYFVTRAPVNPLERKGFSRGWEKSAETIVLLTDRKDRSRALAESIAAVADCYVVGADEPVLCFRPALGVIVDATLKCPNVRRTLGMFSSIPGGRITPQIVLMRTTCNTALREAHRLGATACLSELAEPKVVVGALFRQITPEMSMTDLLVQRSAVRTCNLLAGMFDAAQSGTLDCAKIDDGIDPVVNALREGGIRQWLDIVQAHDNTTLRHCLLVAGLTAHFALHLGLPAKDRTRLVRASLVHDVGKATIPLAILNKPGPLNEAEMSVMRTHTTAGHAILLASGVDDPITLAATRHHHEMLDGTGYPDGLKGDAIGDHVRLLTICDICAALIEQRPYRASMPQAEALGIMTKMAGHKIEKALIDSFVASLAENRVSERSFIKSRAV